MKTPKRSKAPPRVPMTTSGIDLVLAEAASGIGSGEHLNEKLKRAFGIPYAFLTQEQWKEIEAKTGLRHTARFELNIALRRYWIERLGTAVSEKTRNEMDDATKKLAEAHEALANVISNEEVFRGPLEFHQRTPLQQRLALEHTCQSISRAQNILGATAKRFARRRGQPSYGPLYDLINHLDFILFKSHNIRLTRSKFKIPFNGAKDTPSEYVWTVIKGANLQVKKSTVDSILRDYIRDRDAHDRAFPNRSI